MENTIEKIPARISSKLKTRIFFGFLFSFVFSLYLLNNLKNFQDQASNILKGQEKTLVLGHLIDAEVKSALEMIPLSVSSNESNEGFIQKIKNIREELHQLVSEVDQKNLKNADKLLGEIIPEGKSPVMEDVFVYYRNVRASTFNLYRLSWANKWMTVAKSTGHLLEDLNSIPYHQAYKEVDGFRAKINSLSEFVAKVDISTQAKQTLFSYINQLEVTVDRFSNMVSGAEQMRSQRTEVLKKVSTEIKSYNELQGKGLSFFTTKNQENYFKNIFLMALLCIYLAGLYWFAVLRFSKNLEAPINEIAKTFASILKDDGQIKSEALNSVKGLYGELAPLVGALKDFFEKNFQLRRQDQMVKRLLSTPMVLINREKHAVYWNSHFSQMVRFRSFEESGPVPYHHLLKMNSSDSSGANNPVEKVFYEKIEMKKTIEILSTHGNIPVRARSVPFLDRDGMVEYVLLQFQDVREEFKLMDNEINRQLSFVQTALKDLDRGAIPVEAPVDARQQVRGVIDLMKKFSIETQENKELVSGQIQTVFERLSREGGLKKSIHGRLSQIVKECSETHDHLSTVFRETHALVESFKRAFITINETRSKEAQLSRQAQSLKSFIKKEHDLAKLSRNDLKHIDDLTKTIRSREKIIQGYLENAGIQSLNNIISRNQKADISPEALKIMDSMTDVFEQCEKAYKHIHLSVDDLEKKSLSLKRSLDHRLENSVQLMETDHGVVSSAEELQTLYESSQEDYRALAEKMNNLLQFMTDFEAKFSVVEERCRRLEKLGEASLELQNHMESGFKGILDHGKTVGQQSVGL